MLIVDDMRINRIVLASILATHGITSDQAESGMECIDLCRDNDYDLILLDHRMPELDGVDTLVRLKEIFKERGRDIPIICHTSEEGRSNVNLYKAAIFIVDDDKGYLSVIHHWLSPLYNVQQFTSGSEMLSGLSTVTPDLLLLDLEMPKMDGIDVMKILRTEHLEPRIPIILLTGSSNKDIVFHVLEYKPDGYLLKTSPKENILDVIHRFFAESMFKLSRE